MKFRKISCESGQNKIKVHSYKENLIYFTKFYWVVAEFYFHRHCFVFGIVFWTNSIRQNLFTNHFVFYEENSLYFKLCIHTWRELFKLILKYFWNAGMEITILMCGYPIYGLCGVPLERPMSSCERNPADVGYDDEVLKKFSTYWWMISDIDDSTDTCILSAYLKFVNKRYSCKFCEKSWGIKCEHMSNFVIS